MAHSGRREDERQQAISSRFWLSGKLMMSAVSTKHGHDSWQARLVYRLQSQPVQISLIVLLLLDVLCIFAELFLEAEYPACSTLRRRATSCCALDADSHAALAAPMDSFPHETSAHHGAHFHGVLGSCSAPLVEAAGNHVRCLEQGAAHHAHGLLSLGSLAVLTIFEAELLLLVAALGPLFLRSWAYILDLIIITASLGIGLFIHQSRTHAMGQDDAALLEDLQGVILFSRCWRFVRVGHGIAIAMHDLLHASKVELQHKLEELRAAVHAMEADGIRASKLSNEKARSKDMKEINQLLRQMSSHLGH